MATFLSPKPGHCTQVWLYLQKSPNILDNVVTLEMTPQIICGSIEVPNTFFRLRINKTMLWRPLQVNYWEE